MYFYKNACLLISSLLFFAVIKPIAQVSTYQTIEDKIINLGDVSNTNDSSDFTDIKKGLKAFNGNEDFTGFESLKELLKDVEIVLLGEQSHGEGTTYQTKIKLIKYLHEELGFDLLVFESGFYDCQKAAELIEQGETVRTAIGKSVFGVWSYTKEFETLSNYFQKTLKSSNPLSLLGFDSQLGLLSKEHYLSDLAEFMTSIDPSLIQTEGWKHFSTSVERALNYDNKLKKESIQNDLDFIQQLIEKITASTSVPRRNYWIQTLKNVHVQLSDFALNTDDRDEQMAKNLIWLKEQYPDKKLICWGATSHFLYDSKEVRMKSLVIQLLAGYYYKNHFMMGHYVKEKYGKRVYNIGFTAYQGEFGVTSKSKIKIPKKKTVEYILGQSNYDNFLLPLEGLSFEGYPSRTLGNFYMKNDLVHQMDAVVFNRKMERPWFDTSFFIKMNPNSYYAKKVQKKYPEIYGAAMANNSDLTTE